LTCDIHDVAVRGARPKRGGAGHDNHAPADLLGAGGIQFDVVHAPVFIFVDERNTYAENFSRCTRFLD
jgi:hypothetical protein